MKYGLAPYLLNQAHHSAMAGGLTRDQVCGRWAEFLQGYQGLAPAGVLDVAAVDSFFDADSVGLGLGLPGFLDEREVNLHALWRCVGLPVLKVRHADYAQDPATIVVEQAQPSMFELHGTTTPWPEFDYAPFALMCSDYFEDKVIFDCSVVEDDLVSSGLEIRETLDWSLLGVQGSPLPLGPHQRFMQPPVLAGLSSLYPPPSPLVTTLIQGDGLGAMGQAITRNTITWCSGLDALSEPACRLPSGVPPSDPHDDQDGDGFPWATDCHDGSTGSNLHPAQSERPNILDEDCNCYFVTPGEAWLGQHVEGGARCSSITSWEESP